MSSKALVKGTACGYALILVAATAISLTPLKATGQTVIDKAERDELAFVAPDDPVMAAALRKARETLADFLNVTRARPPGTKGFAVKVAIREGDDTEYSGSIPSCRTACASQAASTISRARSAT